MQIRSIVDGGVMNKNNSTQAQQNTAQPTEAELIARAAKLVPVLKERAARCEELRRIPEETVADFFDAGIMNIASPVRFGGMGHGIDTAMMVSLEIGRGCASSAWMAGQWPGHGFIASNFSLEAQQEYWDNPRVLSSTASATVRCEVEEVDGGFMLSGSWKFSSGVDWADWIFPHAPQGMFLVPKKDFRIEDDWHVFGLSGTGSKTATVDRVFIPEHRFISFESAFITGRTPGALVHRTPFHFVPFSVWGGHMLGASAIGMARGLIEAFDERIRDRADPQSRQPSVTRQANQMRFGEATAEVETAVILLKKTLADLKAIGAEERVITEIERARARRDIAFAIKLCVQAGQRLFGAGDSRGIYRASAGQRFYRDLQAAATHMTLTWDTPAIEFARVHWGLPSESFVVNRSTPDLP